jgi:flagellar biosynthesis/type III secretory pathway protein FliH
MLHITKQRPFKIQEGQKIIRHQDWQELQTLDKLILQAEKELKEAHEQLALDRIDEEKKGFLEGFEKGEHTFFKHLKLFEEKIREMRLEMQKSMLPLVIKATKKVVAKELEISPETIVDIVMDAIQPVLTSKIVRIFVRKEDLAIIEKEKPQIKALFEAAESFTIGMKEDLEIGSCLIETDKGVINSSIDLKIKALESAFERFGTPT